MDHDTLTGFAKSWGLFYLIALAVGVIVYVFWPSNRKRFERAKFSILERDDRPKVDGTRNDRPKDEGRGSKSDGD
jgi:cytochrome c oxidase cbb3-type subunit 4